MSRGTERYETPCTPETETCPIADFDDLVKVSPSLANEISNAVVFEVIGADTEADGARLLLEAVVYHSGPTLTRATTSLRVRIQERLDEIAVNFDGLLLVGGETNNVKRYNDAYATIPDNEYYRLSRNARMGARKGKVS